MDVRRTGSNHCQWEMDNLTKVELERPGFKQEQVTQLMIDCRYADPNCPENHTQRGEGNESRAES